MPLPSGASSAVTLRCASGARNSTACARKRHVSPTPFAPSALACFGGSANYSDAQRSPWCARRTPASPTDEAAAKQAGWTIERDAAIMVVRDIWAENEDHAAWLVATKVGLPLERVTVWAGREA
jgi:hypothetical protein